MTKRNRFEPEGSSPQPAQESQESEPPPPPPGTPQEEDDQDVGLATEMVFSGHERQQLRDAPDYETYKTGTLSFDDEELYQDIAPADDSESEDETQPGVSEGQSERLEITTTPGQSFDPRQYYSQQTGTTNEPFAFVMFILLVLVALGIFSALGWLIYQLIMGL